ncbi:hypothetical protein [Persicobacter psychrovividus]|uniref:Uncharacterized protein n=1 Tax=Persicobacter psychrovividus TaxID=387638 RepID=A0ABM7VDP6_9BACT|nr:hypothetical protein PEPS_13570 [Persicobacter psychrovividus]
MTEIKISDKDKFASNLLQNIDNEESIFGPSNKPYTGEIKFDAFSLSVNRKRRNSALLYIISGRIEDDKILLNINIRKRGYIEILGKLITLISSIVLIFKSVDYPTFIFGILLLIISAYWFIKFIEHKRKIIDHFISMAE